MLFRLGIKKFLLPKYRKPLKSELFYFSSSKYTWVLNILFLKYKTVPFLEIKESSVSWNIKSLFGFCFLKYKKFSWDGLFLILPSLKSY